MLYETYQAGADLLLSPRTFAEHAARQLSRRRSAYQPSLACIVAAAYEVFASAKLTHVRPDYGIKSLTVYGHEMAIAEEAAHVTPFGTLLHFRKDSAVQQPRMLIVAPMSGHFATLVRDTVRTMLADHDVYITDWHNARDVPLSEGIFGLDEYAEHVIRFLEVLGPGTHLLAICQPCVASLAATALMAEDDHPAQPRSLTLMAGPIDARISPTKVNELAVSKPIEWFERNLICRVPMRHAGAFRRVYPGFLQLSAFMSMNLERHLKSFLDLYNHLSEGNSEKAAAIRAFYQEYFAVADLDAAFFIETVRLVFQEHVLPRGEMTWRGRRIDPRAIRRTALLTVEGERDDICAIGQTMAAHDLCTSVRPYMKRHHMQAGVGHYGVFSGRHWSAQIYPIVRDQVYLNA